MLTLELCDEYRNTGAPSCAAWLAGTSDQPPDHVCYGAAADSTARWAEERELKLLVGLVGKGGVFSIYWYAGMWPLPVGARSLEDGVVIQCCQEIGFWGGEVPTLLSPPSLRAAPDDAWLGLVARRQTRAGTAWLFGLLEMGFVIKGAATGLNFFNVRTWEDDFAPGVENFVRCSPDGGAVESMERWRWVGHIVLIEASPAKPGELAALAAEADRLTKWYNATLLGKKFEPRGGGRPVGSTAIPDAEFLAHYEAAYRRVWRDIDRRPDKDDIYREMGISRSTFYEQVARLSGQGIKLPVPSEPAPPDPKP